VVHSVLEVYNDGHVAFDSHRDLMYSVADFFTMFGCRGDLKR